MIAGREIFFKTNLDKSSNVPVYLQLYNYLKSLIINRVIILGDTFPSEAEFCQNFNLSRTTVRQAFMALEKDDLIIRIKGKGTFVSEPKVSRSLNNLYSFSGEMSSLGFETRAIVRSFNIVKADTKQRQLFGKQDDDIRLFKIVRLRFVNELPLTLETVYIPVDRCPVLNEELLKASSLYSILHQYSGIIPNHASEIYSSVNLTKGTAQLLGCRSGSSAFLVNRVSYDIQETVFELADIYIRGDRCRYEVDLKASNVSFLRHIDQE